MKILLIQYIGQNEYNYSQIARKAGIIMPETRLFEGKYFGVKRFDRKGEKRIHMHTAAGILHANFRIPSLDYKTLIETTLFLTHDIQEAEKMFRLMAFRIISESSRRFASMSYSAISASRSAGVHIQSPSTFLANTVLPAPIKVILIFIPPVRIYVFCCLP